MEEKLKVIKIIHASLCIGLIVAYYILGDLDSILSFSIPSIDASNIIFALLPIIAYFLSNYLYKLQLRNIDSNLKLEDKYPIYQTASLVRWAVLEAAAFIILLLNKDFILFGVLIILYLILIRPTENSMKVDLSENSL